MTAATRVLRTCAQVLAALVVVIPAVVTLLGTVGVHLDGAALAATGAAAVAVVSGLQNALESAGKIPVLGAPKPAEWSMVGEQGPEQVKPTTTVVVGPSLRASAPSTSTEARPEDGPQPEDPYR